MKLEEGEDELKDLTQYSVRCSEVDKFLLTYVILKLKLVRGKCILFVNDVERCYRLKLFLEQFSIKSCVLNSELPLNSRLVGVGYPDICLNTRRYHTVQEFNKGVYDYVIASDESATTAEHDTDDEVEEVEREECAFSLIICLSMAYTLIVTSTQREAAESSASASQKRKRPSPAPPSSRKRKQRKGGGKEYGVTRGVDFIDVSCVLNFDLPSSSRAYTHRVGRTARAGRSGMALSFVVPSDLWGKSKVVGGVPSTKNDETVFARIEREQAARGSKVKEYQFDMKQVEAFRYRMEDALRAVTRNAIKEARVKELKTEILNSDKLKVRFPRRFPPPCN